MNLESERATKIRKEIVRALADFQMINQGDRVLVCVSGGKDSSILLAQLLEIQRRAEIEFEVEAAILDQKQPGFSVNEFQAWVESLGVRFHIVERDTYSIVKEKIPEGAAYCSLCSRLRRAILYDFAFDHGFTKIALGHHRDDLMQTTLLNLFYTGQLATMPAKLKSDDGRNILIRPLVYVAEKEIIELANDWKFPVIPCNLCGSQDGLKRKRMKRLLNELEKEIPNIGASMLNALGNVKTTQLLDHNLRDFKNLAVDRETF